MAVAYDTVSVQADSEVDFSHTVTGSDPTIVAVFLGLGTSTSTITASPTYNGVSLTQRDSVAYSYGFNRWIFGEIWTLDNPATGSNTFSFSWSATPTAGVVILMSFSGANNGIGTNTFNSDSSGGTTDTPTDTQTTDASDSMIVGGAIIKGGDSDPFSPGTGVTETADGATGTNPNADIGYTAGYMTATGGSDTFEFTGSVSDEWVILGVEVLATGGGGPSPPTIKKLALLGVG